VHNCTLAGLVDRSSLLSARPGAKAASVTNMSAVIT
jgi:hypothetical protein